MARKKLPIGIDDFWKIRTKDYYFVDKSLMIREFLEMGDQVALVARPRRFGKTLNMTMLREFLDITRDSGRLFEGLAIMDTQYAACINSRPVIYFTFKNCRARTAAELVETVRREICGEYIRYEAAVRALEKEESYEAKALLETAKAVMKPMAPPIQVETAIDNLLRIVKRYYTRQRQSPAGGCTAPGARQQAASSRTEADTVRPVLLIDEYDQPIMSSYEYGYHEELGTFFTNLYGMAMKGNDALDQALLTGVQRVVKESIFSQFNNPKVYTVFSRQYGSSFGLTEAETRELLEAYGLELNEQVKKKYDGYRMGGVEVYNPWSILNYADNGFLDNYWVNTSANFLIRKGLKEATRDFWKDFDVLVTGEPVQVWLTLDTSYAERDSDASLWGLFVNAGYLTVTERVDADSAVVRIPNEEVMSEFRNLVSEISGINNQNLNRMFDCLMKKDMKRFFALYEDLVISCTSYMDAKENAYHMLFLGMCMTLGGAYKVTSNLEAGYGRSDITLEAKLAGYPSIIVEFKQGKDLESLKSQALDQILDNRYYTGLSGQVLCVGMAHDGKRCSMVYEIVDVDRI